MSNKKMLALLLIAALGGCGHLARTDAPPTDPGQLPWADAVEAVAGLTPCDDGPPGRPLRIDTQRPVYILVHGQNGSRASLHELARALVARDQQAVCFDFDGRGSLEQASGQLAAAIDSLAPRLASKEITVLGHSVGGLIARRALTVDGPRPVRHPDVKLQLVTVAAPFAGIASARPCGNTALRVATLGLIDLGCWLISGDRWRELAPSSDFIRHPGALLPQVRHHLQLVTDERGRCRHRPATGPCERTDQMFSLGEQDHPSVRGAPNTRRVTLPVGHTEVIGESGGAPVLLLELLQREGLVSPLAGRTDRAVVRS